jgi:hypothetical protein
VAAEAPLDSAAQHPASPLEDFLRDYLETVGGAWDEVEPQVYDVLLPASPDGTAGESVLRLTFDPEALPDYPDAQLASFGTPLIDRVLGDAARRGRCGRFYLVGLNLHPHNLASRARRALTLEDPLGLEVRRVRALDFTQAVFWFGVEFVSDQKEQEVVPVAIDLPSGRQVRHLDDLLDRSRLAAEPAVPLPEARRMSLAAGCEAARQQALRTIAALANVRGRELADRLHRQVQRVSVYYADLRNELNEQVARARKADEAKARLPERLAAIDREEQMRTAELRQKSALRARVRLLQVLLVQQPKLLLAARLLAPNVDQPIDLVWDPLSEALEPPACPSCGRPTFELRLQDHRVVCPACPATPAHAPRRR